MNEAARNWNELLLNSSWGRFSVRSNLIAEAERFPELLFSDEYEVSPFCSISDEAAMVQWRYADGRASVMLMCLSSPRRRLTLYDLLNVCCTGTGSVVFTSRPGDWVPSVGPHLGALMDELNDEGGLYPRVCVGTAEMLRVPHTSGQSSSYM